MQAAAFFLLQLCGGWKVAVIVSPTGPVIGTGKCVAAIWPTVRSKLTVGAGV